MYLNYTIKGGQYMSALVWDQVGERFYETGVDHVVLYPINTSGTYPKGVVWNGITAINEAPSGAESNPQYADNIKYLDLTSAEEFGGTIEALTYPDEFGECDGSIAAKTGVILGQQRRKMFGLSYRTKVGNDTDGQDHGYKLHLIYGAKVSPSDRGYNTVNDSPEAITFSWEFSTTPVTVIAKDKEGNSYRPVSSITIDSRTADPTKLAELEKKLYGAEASEASLPSPDEVLTMFAEE